MPAPPRTVERGHERSFLRDQRGFLYTGTTQLWDEGWPGSILHREDGPAVIYISSYRLAEGTGPDSTYYLNNKLLYRPHNAGPLIPREFEGKNYPMSYDIDLIDPNTKEVLELDEKHQIRGGTFVLGGTKKLTLNVTYNYAEHFYRVLDNRKGIRVIYGMTGADAIPLLQAAADKLGDDVDEKDYWNGTEGNAKKALLNLIELAKMRPDGVFKGD